MELDPKITKKGYLGNSSHRIDAVAKCGNGYLYNIKEDPLEQHNLATKMSDVLKKIHSKLAQYQSTRFNPDRSSEWPGTCEVAINNYGYYWGLFLDYSLIHG